MVSKAFKQARQDLETLGRDIRDSETGQRFAEAFKDAGDYVKDFFNRDDVKAKLQSVEHEFIEFRDKVADHFKANLNKADVDQSLDNMQKQIDELSKSKPDDFEANCAKILNAMKPLDAAVPAETPATFDGSSSSEVRFAGDYSNNNNADITPDL